MARMAVHIGESRAAARNKAAQAIVSMPQSRTTRRASAPLFAPGGQSTQMIVGADATDDRTILATSARLYGVHRLRRVYYSAFSPIPDAARALPLAAPPTVREHRLYQADWLMRFTASPTTRSLPPSQVGMLALDMDPKLAWALAHRERFPVNLNTARASCCCACRGLWRADGRPPAGRPPRATPAACRPGAAACAAAQKVLPFVEAADYRPAGLEAADLAAHLAPPPVQRSLF